MELFENEINATINLLPRDGTVCYFGKVLTPPEAAGYFAVLMKTIAWKNDEAVIFGKHLVTKRKVAWYGNERYSYTYSGTTREALPWTKELLELKKLAEQKSGNTFNSCLLNLYHDGSEGMGWHSDDERSLGKNTAIASLSFGAERKFCFRHKKTKETISIILETGSLLVMKDETQTNWHHRLPPAKKINSARVNLTFRAMVP